MPVPNNVDMLNDMNKINSLLATTGTALPENWGIMQPSDKQNFLDQLMMQSEKAKGVSQAINDNAKSQKDMIKDMENQGVNVQTNVAPILSSKKFNLKKAQMMPQEMAPQAPQAQQPQQFQDGTDVKDWLNNMGDPNVAIEALKKYTNSNQVVTDPNTQSSEEALGVIKEAVFSFFSTDNPQEQLDAASEIFKMILPDSAKSSEQNGIPTQLETTVPNIAKIVDETNRVIKKLAEETKKANKTFNLTKMAQQKTIENVITQGPTQTRIDPFTGMLISDWHLIERNKGFGLKIDDVLDIDFESIWRGNIMDKYYSPYRDKEGNWVGGYIENRFEVDKNIPPLNNYQLKPGEKRRPYVPEYSSTEARLEASRKDLNKERGYAPAEDGKVFNWKEASKKKVTTKTAQLKPLPEPTLPGEKIINTTPTESCPICKSNIAKGVVVCPNCKANISQREYSKPKTAPDPKGPQNIPNGVVPLGGGRIASYNAKLSTVMSSADAIFFDGQNFIVYANNIKEKFDTFEDAESFKTAQQAPGRQISEFGKTQPVRPPVVPVVPQKQEVKRMPIKSRKPVDLVDINKQKEIHESAHGLAIDG